MSSGAQPCGEADWPAQVESYLKAAFPLVHSKLALTKVNTHGLLYTWQGSDPSLKPSMLMAHQDTVPVNSETLNDWTYRALFPS